MKRVKKLVIFLLLIVMAVAVVGCSKSKKKSTNQKTVINKKTQIKVTNFVLDSDSTFTIIYEEDFDEDYYDKNELESMIDSEVNEFNSNYALSSSSGMSKKELLVENGKAKLSLKFIDSHDYIEYEKNYVDSKRNAKLFIGEYDDAVSEGYKAVGRFTDLTGNKIDDVENLAKGEGMEVLFTNQGFNMTIRGEVVAFNGSVEYDSESGLYITSDKKENYIIYKRN
ncbi:MAG: hypothetical protein II919_07355 [Lachnospiraceae bacterium]|nr:hypothetical protein [Lachnospiraceae bacterium]